MSEPRNATETVIRDMLGDQQLTIARLKAAYDALSSSYADLKRDHEALRTEQVKTSIWKMGESTTAKVNGSGSFES